MELVNKIKIDTNKRTVSLNDVELDSVIGVWLDWSEGQFPQVKIKLASHVFIDGVLAIRDLKPIYCPSCHFKLGDFANTFGVICPFCGEMVNNANAMSSVISEDSEPHQGIAG